MTFRTDPRTFGVEEELLLVDPENGAPQAVSGSVIRYARRHDELFLTGGRRSNPLETELQREQLETATPVCTSLGEVSEHVRSARLAAAESAAGAGVAVAALATSPVSVRPSLTPTHRYLRMADAYGPTADEQLTCGCHVHVGVESPDEGVAVLDRIRPWLPPLLALSANSPFWQGADTGYDSWRHQVWSRWPSSGPTELFGSAEGYRATVEALLATGALVDEGMIYFDARLSRRYPTVEIRVPDVCLRADDAVLVAALVRALVDTAAAAWRSGERPDPVRADLMRLAMWRAGRSGLRDDLVHPCTRRAAPAREVVGALLDHLSPALDRSGDLGTVAGLLRDVLERGNGAQRQRADFTRTHDVTAVVTSAVEQTIAF
ncbi:MULTISPECIES: carboxylate-amine ligase [Actinomadura]|uniref:carboxylate-amine ligase n=1 Tax=Actinomadura TaxID=1988 RepID=UPI0003AD20BB|nr:glutamate--cysteine ligase [Actinomadura madurae]MCP9971189.1 glutamate--cysteine ligase [Actinomadura madurae]MCQ0019916.1 glutamate--cysteine ligase [Actinomadura madurae]URM99941.1 glutamate--cysteine ligase [Actinomadura madurae]URN02108.1 glutamate--cysteine ligase [Actinomadura madurae]